MGHYCWMCERCRLNDRFSGGEHKRHLCRDCSKTPNVERERIRVLHEIPSYLWQRNISAKNIKRLKALTQHDDVIVREWAKVVLEIARVRPGRRKRIGFLKHNRPDLLCGLIECGFIEDWTPELYSDEPTEWEGEQFLEWEETLPKPYDCDPGQEIPF